jgi:hypothetical protein
MQQKPSKVNTKFDNSLWLIVWPLIIGFKNQAKAQGLVAKVLLFATDRYGGL